MVDERELPEPELLVVEYVCTKKDPKEVRYRAYEWGSLIAIHGRLLGDIIDCTHVIVSRFDHGHGSLLVHRLASHVSQRSLHSIESRRMHPLISALYPPEEKIAWDGEYSTASPLT